MSDLRVPKDKINVTLHFDKETKLEGMFFIGPLTVGTPDHTKISKLLEDDKVFIPFLVESAGKTELINKSLVQTVEWDYPESDGSERIDTSLFHTTKVEITFTDGSTIEGLLVSQVPRDRSRLSDCMNIEQKFLSLVTDKSHIHINKDMLRKVTSTE